MSVSHVKFIAEPPVERIAPMERWLTWLSASKVRVGLGKFIRFKYIWKKYVSVTKPWRKALRRLQRIKEPKKWKQIENIPSIVWCNGIPSNGGCGVAASTVSTDPFLSCARIMLPSLLCSKPISKLPPLDSLCSGDSNECCAKNK